MALIRNIVAATDFSPGSHAAVERAVQLALAHGASLGLLHAFDASGWHSLERICDAQHLRMSAPPDMRLKQRLDELAASLATQTGLKVEPLFSIGAADSAIYAYATAHACSLVVIGSRGEPGMPGLGSTASKVVRSPACPILIARSTESRPCERVLSAIDMRDGSKRAAGFAITLFPQARHHLLYAVCPTPEHSLWMNGMEAEQVRLLHEAMHTQALHQLEHLAQELTPENAHPVAVEVIDDLPARAIIARAAALPADCVAVGHHSQGMTTEHLLGSMAQQVLQHTQREVLVVP